MSLTITPVPRAAMAAELLPDPLAPPRPPARPEEELPEGVAMLLAQLLPPLQPPPLLPPGLPRSSLALSGGAAPSTAAAATSPMPSDLPATNAAAPSAPGPGAHGQPASRLAGAELRGSLPEPGLQARPVDRVKVAGSTAAAVSPALLAVPVGTPLPVTAPTGEAVGEPGIAFAGLGLSPETSMPQVLPSGAPVRQPEAEPAVLPVATLPTPVAPTAPRQPAPTLPSSSSSPLPAARPTASDQSPAARSLPPIAATGGAPGYLQVPFDNGSLSGQILISKADLQATVGEAPLLQLAPSSGELTQHLRSHLDRLPAPAWQLGEDSGQGQSSREHPPEDDDAPDSTQAQRLADAAQRHSGRLG
jgi:hypothetical protein